MTVKPVHVLLRLRAQALDARAVPAAAAVGARGIDGGGVTTDPVDSR